MHESLGSPRAWILAGLLLGTGLAPAFAGAFVDALSDQQRQAAGLAQLSAEESARLEQLVADDLARAGVLRDGEFALPFGQRHSATERQAAGLDRLDAAQQAQLDDLVAAALADRPKPRERPRLKDNEVVSLARRLQVHGGMSFTYGWASGGRNFREVGAWVSYFDPVTGLGLAIAYNQFSGDYNPYAWYDYDRGYGYGYPYLGATSGNDTAVRLSWVSPPSSISERGGLFAIDAQVDTVRTRGGGMMGGRGGRRF